MIHLGNGELARRIVVEEEQGLCTRHDEVIHTHRHQIDAHPAVVTRDLCNLEYGL